MFSLSSQDRHLAEATVSTLHRFLLRNNSNEEDAESIRNIGTPPLTEEKCNNALFFLNSQGEAIGSAQIAIIGSKSPHFQTIESQRITPVNGEKLENDNQLLIVSVTAKKALEKYAKHLKNHPADVQAKSNQENGGCWKIGCSIL